MRRITANTHPDHDTICGFRRNNFDLIAECFVEVLRLAREMRILKAGTAGTDGTELRANAGKRKNISYERAEEPIGQLAPDVKELMEKAKKADKEGTDEGRRLPGEISRIEKLREKIKQARADPEKQAKEKAIARQEEHKEKVKNRNKRKGRRKGKKIKPPDDKPSPDKQINMVDPDSGLMRKNKRSGYERSYNARAEEIPGFLGAPEPVLADNGYLNGEHVKCLEEKGIEVLASPGAEAKNTRRRYDFRPSKLRSGSMREPKAGWIIGMKKKIQSEEGRTKYKLRKQTVEPVFGIIRNVPGFGNFMLGGLEKATGEWNLATLWHAM